MEDLLKRYGIPFYWTNFLIPLDGKSTTLKLDQKVSQNTAYIFGLNCEVDGTEPDNTANNLISYAQSFQLWINLKFKSTDYCEKLRLCNLVYRVSGFPIGTDGIYFKTSILGKTDWQQSSIINAHLINNATVMINYFYIDDDSYNFLVDKGALIKR